MLRFLSTLTIAALLGLAAPAYSQDTTTATEEVTTETEVTPAEVTEVVDETFPVAGDVTEEDGGQFVREQHGDWEIRCIKDTTGDVCRMYQLLADQDGNSIAEINVIRLPGGGQAAAGVTLATPLGTLLTSQVAMRVDSGGVKKYPFGWCEQFGCFARFGLTNTEIGGLKKGVKATITIVAVVAPEEPINLTLSLKGFTAGWNSLEGEG